jgi:glycine/D-amino acid oxidase-like deaminating enzyme
MTQGPQVIIIGAGILGLASAYHLLKNHEGLDLLVVERLKGSGQGDTARSAAAFRDMFSSPVNRQLSQGSIAFYESVEKESHRLGLKKIGYLWLATAGREATWRQTLAHMADAGVEFMTLEVQELTARLPELHPLDISEGILGLNCGILDSARLIRFYEQEILRLGGRLRHRSEVTGFSRDGQGQINGVRVGAEEIRARTVIVATGAWTGRTMALAPAWKFPWFPGNGSYSQSTPKKGPWAISCKPLVSTLIICCPLPFCQAGPIFGQRRGP